MRKPVKGLIIAWYCLGAHETPIGLHDDSGIYSYAVSRCLTPAMELELIQTNASSLLQHARHGNGVPTTCVAFK